MHPRHNSRVRPALTLSFALLLAFLVVLWIAGGASRADVFAQVVTRAAAWAVLIALIVFSPLPRLRPVAPVAAFVFAATALVAIQLIPLPPSLWMQLPGRELFAEAAILTGQEQPWRPLSISPGATINSLSSMIVPVVTLLLVSGLTRTEEWRLIPILLSLILASSVIGLVQFSGARFDHPLLNDVFGAVSGTFANRNHFALFAALGCLLAPAWAFKEGHRPRWRAPVAVALVLFFVLLVLATGSRMGMVVGVLAVALSLLSVRREIIAELRRLPRWMSLAVLGAAVAALAAAVVLSVTLDRADSIDRALSMEVDQDLRTRALPTVLNMIVHYFPFGSGAGAFDPAYRITEPDALLSTRYFNHAHNDLLEVVLDAGLAGLLLLVAAILWWLWKSFGAWRSNEGSSLQILRRLGSGALLLVIVASITDYPARTPMIMAVIVIAATWLNAKERRSDAAMSHRRRSERATRLAAVQG